MSIQRISRGGVVAASAVFASHVHRRRSIRCETAPSTAVTHMELQTQGRQNKVGKSGVKLKISAGTTNSEYASATCAYRVEEKNIAELSADMASGRVTSEKLVEAYLLAIREVDQSGPTLRSVIQVNPHALADARALDIERASGKIRGALHGIPILVKDNIETADPMPTTAGSLALLNNLTRRDAPVVANLRAAGAVILGKTNLSEWANIRSSRSSSGWSAVGGLTRNPYALDRTAVGSSSGSGAGVAANLAVAALGTETDGSVTCPAAVAGLVGLKPTVGLVSRRYIVPISHSQDTAGPMARTVEDAACLLTAMAGTDPDDHSTWDAGVHKSNYVDGLSSEAFHGARVGVARFLSRGWDAAVKHEFERALERMRNMGAELIEIEEFSAMKEIETNELTVLLCELKAGLNKYLSDAAPGVQTRSLADVIAFNKREADRELVYFEQELFEQAEATEGLETMDYQRTLEANQRMAGPEGIDYLLRQHNLDALIAPTLTPAWTIDLVNGDHFGGAASSLAAVAGYPHLTVPMGQVFGLPVGISFIGSAWSEQRLLSLGFAFEKQTQARKPPTFVERLPAL